MVLPPIPASSPFSSSSGVFSKSCLSSFRHLSFPSFPKRFPTTSEKLLSFSHFSFLSAVISVPDFSTKVFKNLSEAHGMTNHQTIPIKMVKMIILNQFFCQIFLK